MFLVIYMPIYRKLCVLQPKNLKKCTKMAVSHFEIFHQSASVKCYFFHIFRYFRLKFSEYLEHMYGTLTCLFIFQKNANRATPFFQFYSEVKAGKGRGPVRKTIFEK